MTKKSSFPPPVEGNFRRWSCGSAKDTLGDTEHFPSIPLMLYRAASVWIWSPLCFWPELILVLRYPDHRQHARGCTGRQIGLNQRPRRLHGRNLFSFHGVFVEPVWFSDSPIANCSVIAMSLGTPVLVRVHPFVSSNVHAYYFGSIGPVLSLKAPSVRSFSTKTRVGLYRQFLGPVGLPIGRVERPTNCRGRCSSLTGEQLKDLSSLHVI